MMGLAWSELWYYGVMFLTFLLVLHIVLFSGYQKALAPSYPYQIIFVLIFAIGLFFSWEPVLIYGDKWVYELDFFKANSDVTQEGKDVGFYLYIKFVAFLTDSSAMFFFITALVYMTGYYVFIQKKIVAEYRLLLFITIITSMGFYAYANNTLRAGLALSLFLLLLSRNYFFKLPTFLLIVVVITIHKSLLLPVLALVLSLLYRRKDNYLALWVACLALSLAAGSTFVNLFGEFFSFADERVTQYSSGQSLLYKTGFRWDFVVFSLLPIALAHYYKRKGYHDPFYEQMLSMYIIANAFWLLLIRMPFSDRLASLSWFLIPVLIMYPLLTKRIFEKQHFWIAGVLMINALITFTLNMK